MQVNTDARFPRTGTELLGETQDLEGRLDLSLEFAPTFLVLRSFGADVGTATGVHHLAFLLM
ncbi:hypothetical protein E5F05_04405 (plasmid) [Deinococcus metallilatus]|uniref:Uncharacterized protein n=1 Tax=Deinococcus metallilatus TaxID=1211322 RepID=A0AAJ5F5B1_9DEIO|nr:hypothetical protein [Deinococcus metallilatus]MBB5293814.1 hypothetical protein [Deinococcus metallilatus]QBY07229.1 hypothetical protein E5F05_04405 [Deinococcus metallilatus]RXJ14701.1 hypothetical protein ERJ73_03135 [Deinococcus metallilatus]TLK30821.1 hypothetical protein FCS05_03450 [Deinococcus metallilatus]GMA17745.1 hypothetical protein GCM10025871_40760 [Deinococcus metallilatus]